MCWSKFQGSFHSYLPLKKNRQAKCFTSSICKCERSRGKDTHTHLPCVCVCVEYEELFSTFILHEQTGTFLETSFPTEYTSILTYLMFSIWWIISNCLTIHIQACAVKNIFFVTFFIEAIWSGVLKHIVLNWLTISFTSLHWAVEP